MQRRGRSGQPVKGRRTTRPKARKAPIGHASLASLRDKLDQVTRELGEACQRETATSEVLKVISSSPGELEPVFDAMLANATRICEAKIGVLYLRDEDDLRQLPLLTTRHLHMLRRVSRRGCRRTDRFAAPRPRNRSRT